MLSFWAVFGIGWTVPVFDHLAVLELEQIEDGQSTGAGLTHRVDVDGP